MNSQAAPIPRFALSREEAAESIGVSLRTFEARIQPDLQLVRLGRRLIVPCDELQSWVTANKERILERADRP